jgi:ribosome-binding protein aMBF1 (putative translation factor)
VQMSERRNGRQDRSQHGLGDAVKELRERQRLSRQDLAHKAGLSASVVRDVEMRGANLSWHSSRSLAAALGVSHPQLADLADRREKDRAWPPKKLSISKEGFRISTVRKVVPRW